MNKNRMSSAGIDTMRNLINQKDWSKTPLGSQHAWSQNLRTMVDLLISIHFPSLLLWGPELTQIYNDGFKEIAGNKHPMALGQSNQEFWSEVWHINQPIYEQVFKEGKSVVLENQSYPAYNGHANKENTYFTLSYSPAYGPKDEVSGIFITIFETTKNVEAEQKLRESEIKYRTLFNSIDEGFCTIKMILDEKENPVDYRFIELNPAFESQTGLVNVEGKLMKSIEPNHESYWFEIYGRIAKTGKSERFIKQAQYLGRWFDVYAFRIGEPEELKVAVLFRDITEQRNAEKALKRSESRLDAFVTATSEVIYRMNPDWTQMYYLNGQEFIIDTAEPSETWLTEYIPDHEQERVMKAIRDSINSKSIFDLEHQVVQVDGTLGWTHSRALPELDEKGEIIEWFGTAIDITERKQREQSDHFLLRLSDQIRDIKDPKVIQETCIKLLAKELNLDRAYFVQYSNKRDKVRVEPEYHHADLPAISGYYLFSEFPEAIHGIPQDMLVFDDITKDNTLSNQERTSLLELGFHSWIGVPLKSSKNAAEMALYAVFGKPHRWTEVEKVMLKETTERAWSAIKRNSAEQELRQNEEYLQMVQETAQLGSWKLDIKTGNFTSSPICKAHFGRTPEEPFSFDDILASIHPDDWNVKANMLQKSLESGEEYSYEYRILWPDGARRWIFTRARSLEGATITGITLDITKRKEIEEELELQTRALQNSRYKLRSLVNDLSKAEENQRFILAGELHDNLGQILDLSKLKLDLFLQKNTEQIPREVFEIKDLITEAIACTRKLINDLKPTPTEEKEELGSALKWVAGKMEKHGLSVNINDNRQYKTVDQVNLNTVIQVVQELLFNVAKHAETDRAWITIRNLTDFLEIKVADNGIGFDPAKHKESMGGEGFGLFNVRQRIDLLGGYINIESEPGNGTTARVQIPQKNEDDQEGLPHSSKSTVANGQKKLKGRPLVNVLVVDDHQMMREGIEGIINTEDDIHVSGGASSAEEAILMVEKLKPDIVIIDINLPGMNGIEAIKIIKSNFPNIKIIGISFLNEQKMIDDVFKAGASDFISKDETLQSICHAIRDAVGTSNY